MNTSELKKMIREIRSFRIALERILENIKGVKISFDTEKRFLLDKVERRWETDHLSMQLEEKLKLTEDILSELYEENRLQRDGALGTIVLLLTVISLVEIFDIGLRALSPLYSFSPIVQLIILILGPAMIALLLTVYLRFYSKQ